MQKVVGTPFSRVPTTPLALPFYTTKNAPCYGSNHKKCAALAAIARYITIIYSFTQKVICRFQSRVLLIKEALPWPMVLKEKSIAMVFKETAIYYFILPNKNCQRHLETRVSNVWNLIQSDQ